jgi:hypothetical protein
MVNITCWSSGIVIDFDPVTAQVTASFGGLINHMSVFLLVGGILTCQFEIELRRFVRINLRVVDRCLDLAVYKKDHFIIRDWQLAHAIVSGRIRPNNFLEAASVFGLNVDLGAGDRLAFGIFDHTLNSSGAHWGGSPCGYGRNDQSGERELERFNNHEFLSFRPVKLQRFASVRNKGKVTPVLPNRCLTPRTRFIYSLSRGRPGRRLSMKKQIPSIDVVRSAWRRVKKDIKDAIIRDLKPVKDVKGGGGVEGKSKSTNGGTGTTGSHYKKDKESHSRLDGLISNRGHAVSSLRLLGNSINVRLNIGQSKITEETWEQVKIAYAAGAGLREFARKMNIPEGTVLAHAKRKCWTQQIEAVKQDAKSMQSNAITPFEALATTLNERKDKSRLHLSKYVVGASERAAQSNGNLEIAGKVQKVAQVHGSVWPEKEQQGSGVFGGLSVYSQQTVIAVETRKSDSQPP